jgi:hypothetical protein
MGGLTAVQIKVLELRYGLSGHPPLLLIECAKKMHRTKQWMQHSEMAGKRHLASHQEIMRGFQRGLQAIQARLWRRLAGKDNALISNQVALRDLYKRAGGPESLLIKVCHGNVREWLNKNSPSTPKGWLIPIQPGSQLTLSTANAQLAAPTGDGCYAPVRKNVRFKH